MPPDYPHTSAPLCEVFQYAPSERFARKSRKQKRHGRCSMDGDCFCTNETWAWLTKGGRTDALDDFCNSLGVVVTRRGKWLRDRWVHPYSASDSARCAAYQHHRWTSNGRIKGKLAHCLPCSAPGTAHGTSGVYRIRQVVDQLH